MSIDQIYKLKQGIYSTTDYDKLISEKRGVTVAVHPFFFKKNDEKNRSYELGLQETLRKLKNYLIILEEEDSVLNTLEEISRFYISNPIVIPTIEYDPQPSRTGWLNVAQFIRELWDEKNSIQLIGGLFSKTDEFGCGCLGFTKYKLEIEFRLPVKIIEELTFS
ncbi:hypothetical protein KO317_01435 [Candidatus Micrarchaeota archaeon]|nr:hypothetical protein [Candidatus Micrarchaeota archaeon]